MTLPLQTHNLNCFFRLGTRELRYSSFPNLLKKIIPSLITPEYPLIKVLSNVTLDLKVNKTVRSVGIMGLSGSGKSVFARTISGIFKGEPGLINGKVLFDGKTVFDETVHEFYKCNLDHGRLIKTKKDTAEWRRRNFFKNWQVNKLPTSFKFRGQNTGIIFQDPTAHLSSELDLLEQLCLYKPEEGDICEKSGLTKGHKKVLEDARFPDEYTNRIFLKTNTFLKLSGGERQRFMTALAMAREPELFIADEPVTDLDMFNAHFVKRKLKSLKENDKTKLLLIISHDLYMLEELADIILVFANGEIVESFENECDNFIPPWEKWQVKHPYSKDMISSFRSLYDRNQRQFLLRRPLPLVGSACQYRSCDLWSRYFPECQSLQSRSSEHNPGHYLGRAHCAKVKKTWVCDKDCFIAGQKKQLQEENKDFDTTHLLNCDPFGFVRSADDSCNRADHVLLEMRNVCLGYGQEMIVRDLNLDLFKGHHLGIIGESGSGKSTLAKSIVGLLPPVKGEMKFSDNSGLMKDVWAGEKYNRKELCRRVQYIFQDCGQALASSITIRQNLREACLLSGHDEREISRLWTSVGLDEEHLDKYPSELSGGMQRRAFMVRAFLLLGKNGEPDDVIEAAAKMRE